MFTETGNETKEKNMATNFILQLISILNQCFFFPSYSLVCVTSELSDYCCCSWFKNMLWVLRCALGLHHIKAEAKVNSTGPLWLWKHRGCFFARAHMNRLASRTDCAFCSATIKRGTCSKNVNRIFHHQAISQNTIHEMAVCLSQAEEADFSISIHIW